MPAKWKIKEVDMLVKKLNATPVIAVAGIKGLPSKQLAEIRKKLHGEVQIRVVKNSLINRAFEKAGKPGLKELEAYVHDSSALIFSKDNPFKLAQMFAASRVKAPAKAGQEAPHDIIIPAGDTPFKPGPIIGDLQAVGIKARIQGPIIVVTNDSPVIHKGEKFSAKLASVLSQMQVFPMDIGMDIRAALEEGGMVYGADVLSISRDKVIADIVIAHQSALNLAVEAGIFNKESVEVMIGKGSMIAKGLSKELGLGKDATPKAASEAAPAAAPANESPSS